MFHLMFSASKRLVLPLSLLAILTSHGLTLFIPNYHSMLANTLSKISTSIRSPWNEIDELSRNNTDLKKQNKQLSASNRQMEQKLATHKAGTRKFTQRLSRRIVRNVAVNTTFVLAESVPIYGTAVVVGVTAMDINDGCNTMNEMNELLRQLGQEEDLSGASKVCAYKNAIPSPEDISDYWLNSIGSLKADATSRARVLETYTAETSTSLGGFIDYLIEKLKEKKTAFALWFKQLIFS